MNTPPVTSSLTSPFRPCLVKPIRNVCSFFVTQHISIMPPEQVFYFLHKVQNLIMVNVILCNLALVLLQPYIYSLPTPNSSGTTHYTLNPSHTSTLPSATLCHSLLLLKFFIQDPRQMLPAQCSFADFILPPPIPWMSCSFKLCTQRSFSVQFSSVAQFCPTLCDSMNRSTPGLPIHHQLPEFTQTHVHQVGDAIQPSHPLSPPSPPAPNPSQHQSLFQWVNRSHEVAKVLEFQL